MELTLTGDAALIITKFLETANVSITELDGMDLPKVLNKALANSPDIKKRLLGEVGTSIRKDMAKQLGIAADLNDPSAFIADVKAHIDAQKTDASKDLEKAIKESIKDKEAGFLTALEQARLAHEAKEKELADKLSGVYEKQKNSTIQKITQAAIKGKNLSIADDTLDILVSGLISRNGIEFEFSDDFSEILSHKQNGVPVMNGGQRVGVETTIASLLMGAKAISEGTISVPAPNSNGSTNINRITNADLFPKDTATDGK